MEEFVARLHLRGVLSADIMQKLSHHAYNAGVDEVVGLKQLSGRTAFMLLL